MPTLEEIEELTKGLSEDDKVKLLGLLQGAIPKTGGASGGAGSPVVEQQQEAKPLSVKVPKLPKFSGTQQLKSEPSFRVWKFDVENLQGSYGENEVKRAIHESVIGTAAEVLTRLGNNATVAKILSKYENIFGTVVNEQELLADFYKAEQKQNENVAEWSCRLEEYLCHPKLNDLTSKDKMLKSRFFSGLSSEAIQNAIRHLVESKDFEQLVVSAREAEFEIQHKSTKAVSKPQVADPMLEQLKLIRESVQKLTTKSDEWERRLSCVEQQQSTRPKQQHNYRGSQFPSTLRVQQGQQKEVICFFCKSPGHVKRNCEKFLNLRQSAARGGK